MKPYEEMIKQVKGFISNNKTDKALELLAKEQLSALDKQLIIINSRYAKLKEDQTLDIIDDETAQRTLNKINVDLLALADRIGESQQAGGIELPEIPDKVSDIPAVGTTPHQAAEQASPVKPSKENKSRSPSNLPARDTGSESNSKRYIFIAAGIVIIALIVFFGMQQSKKNTEKKEKDKAELATQTKKKEVRDSIANADKLAKEKTEAEARERAKNIGIGKKFEGGIIFYVDDNGQHGLIMSRGDQSSKAINWYDKGEGKAFAFNADIYGGIKNTERLVKKFGEGTYPAKLCADFEFEGYDDWYLPSQIELDLLFDYAKSLPPPNGFTNDYYWSSTEYNDRDVYYRSFYTGKSYNWIKGNKAKIRAIRKF